MKYLSLIRNTFILSMFLFASISDIFGQGNNLSGVVLDQDTNHPIPFVNVGIKSKFLGTVTDSVGYFKINLSVFSEKDTIQFSRLGYKESRITVRDLKNLFDENIVISLSQTAIVLDEFILDSEAIGKVRLFGNLSPNSMFAYAFNPINSNVSENFGREVAVAIKLNKKSILLDEISFILGTNQFDNLFLRINIYKYSSSTSELPNERIFEKALYIENQYKGIVSVLMDEYEVILDTDFWVSIEFINVSDVKDLGIITIPVKLPFGKMLFRESSLGEWKSGVGIPSIQVKALEITR